MPERLELCLEGVPVGTVEGSLARFLCCEGGSDGIEVWREGRFDRLPFGNQPTCVVGKPSRAVHEKF
jgi:hypothetical protein